MHEKPKQQQSNLAATENPLTKAVQASVITVLCLSIYTFLYFGMQGIGTLVIMALLISTALAFTLRQTPAKLLTAYTMAVLVLFGLGYVIFIGSSV